MTDSDWVNGLAPIAAVLITLAAGWLISQRVTDRWEQMRKRRELDLAALDELYSCYGEFYAVWKLWNGYCNKQNPTPGPPDATWNLLIRATAAEGKVEALLTKIATERVLDEPQIFALGALRQAYHELRHAIRLGKQLPWSRSSHQDYVAFKGLQTLVAGLLTGSSGTRPSSAQAARNFARLTSNGFEQTWPDVAVKGGVYYPDGRDPIDLDRPLQKLT